MEIEIKIVINLLASKLIDLKFLCLFVDRSKRQKALTSASYI